MDVHLVHELVEVVLVARAQVDEGLDGLVRVGGEGLVLRGGDDFDGVVGEDGEIGDRVVHVCRFVDAHEWLVEDGKEGAEEFEGSRLNMMVSVILMESRTTQYLLLR